MVRLVALVVLPFLVPVFASAEPIEETLRGAETRARQADRANSITQQRNEVERVERTLRKLNASSSPFIGENGGEIQQRKVRVKRTITSLPDLTTSSRRTFPTGLQTRILDLEPREVQLGLEIFDE
ncbi:MAG: hypothetical protein AAGE80_14145 [Pseudomonadota bacterium]